MMEDADRFFRALETRDAPLLNQLKKSPLRGQRPIIGYTEDRRRFVHHLVRIGMEMNQRFGRLVPVSADDSRRSSSYDEDYDECDGLYELGHWRWVDRLAMRSAAMAPQPIYDMDWVDPNPPPTKMEWGFKDDGANTGPGVAGEAVGNGGVLGAEEADG